MRAGIIAAMATVAAALVAWPACDAWFDLADARARRAAVDAGTRQAQRPPSPLVTADALLRARDAMAARRAMAMAVIGRARSGGLLVERIAPAKGTPRLAAITLRLSGPEAAVIALADHLERQRPVMCLVRWRMAAAGPGVIRLEAVLVSPWQP